VVPTARQPVDEPGSRHVAGRGRRWSEPEGTRHPTRTVLPASQSDRSQRLTRG
jgi:hypothetical protein